MNYNQFSIDYITVIQKELCINTNEKGEAVFFPDKITHKHIKSLKTRLADVFSNSHSSIDILRNKKDASVQAGLFGLVDDLDKALKVGFLIADRIILIDYIFDRILSKDAEKIDLIHLGAISTFLVQLLPLAKKGRIVIIQNPFTWHKESKQIISEVSETTILTPKLISLLNMLSITKECNLHPYTIAESNEEFKLITEEQIDNVDVIGKTGGDYAYKGILATLLSEKLLDNTEFKTALNIPINEYFEIISINKEFYSGYLAKISSAGIMDAENNIKKMQDDLLSDIYEKNKRLPANIKKAISAIGSVSGSSIALLGIVVINSAPLSIAGILLGLSPTLVGLLRNKSAKNEKPIISVFNELINN